MRMLALAMLAAVGGVSCGSSESVEGVTRTSCASTFYSDPVLEAGSSNILGTLAWCPPAPLVTRSGEVARPVSAAPASGMFFDPAQIDCVAERWQYYGSPAQTSLGVLPPCALAGQPTGMLGRPRRAALPRR
jgi:hypothetical protein